MDKITMAEEKKTTLEKAAGWSEEDEETMQDLIELLWIIQGSSNMKPGIASKYTQWLESLRPSWKPMQVIQKCEETEKSALKKCEEVDLEEEIKRYGKEEMPVVLESDLNDIARHFYELGKQAIKEQMLKEAEECDLYWDGDFLAIDLNMRILGYSERDKVKIVIVKEDKE